MLKLLILTVWEFSWHWGVAGEEKLFVRRQLAVTEGESSTGKVISIMEVFRMVSVVTRSKV